MYSTPLPRKWLNTPRNGIDQDNSKNHHQEISGHHRQEISRKHQEISRNHHFEEEQTAKR